jgi:hypothetical protein
LLLSLSGTAAAQSSDLRPALLGTARTSLINQMDAQGLMKRGQKDGVVSFTLGVNVWGYGSGLTYQGSPDTNKLSQELLDAIDRSKFIPASYQGHPAGAIINGTCVFAVTNGSPHVRIFLNQDADHLKRGDDFVAPQWIFPLNKTTKWFDQDRYYRDEAGMVAVRIAVDNTGKLQSSKVLRVHPERAPFGMEVQKHIDESIFTPAYLNGKPVSSSTAWMIPFSGPYGGKRWL